MLDIQSADPSWQPLLKDFFDSPEGKKAGLPILTRAGKPGP